MAKNNIAIANTMMIPIPMSNGTCEPLSEDPPLDKVYVPNFSQVIINVFSLNAASDLPSRSLKHLSLLSTLLFEIFMPPSAMAMVVFWSGVVSLSPLYVSELETVIVDNKYCSLVIAGTDGYIPAEICIDKNSLEIIYECEAKAETIFSHQRMTKNNTNQLSKEDIEAIFDIEQMACLPE